MTLAPAAIHPLAMCPNDDDGATLMCDLGWFHLVRLFCCLPWRAKERGLQAASACLVGTPRCGVRAPYSGATWGATRTSCSIRSARCTRPGTSQRDVPIGAGTLNL